MRIRTKVLIFFVPLMVVLVAATTRFSRMAVQRVVAEEVARSGLALAVDLAAAPGTVPGYGVKSRLAAAKALASLRFHGVA